MAGGRPGPALFELIKDKTGTVGTSQQQAAAIPVVPPGPRPVDVPVESAPAIPVAVPVAPTPLPLAPKPAAAPEPLEAERPRAWVTERGDSNPVLDGRITVSVSVAWMVVAGFLVWSLLVWIAAWKISENRANAEANRQFAIKSGIHDPLKNGGSEPIPVNPGLISHESPKTPPAPAPSVTEPKSTAPQNQSGTGGAGQQRVIGLNYLMIASRIDSETAERMVKFLGENGVPAVATPVAKGGGGANNPSLYTVYSLAGITREQYRAHSPERTELEDKVKRLGKVWQKEHKGGTDFATVTWEKYGS